MGFTIKHNIVFPSDRTLIETDSDGLHIEHCLIAPLESKEVRAFIFIYSLFRKDGYRMRKFIRRS